MIDRERALAIQQRALRDFVAFMGGAEPRSRLLERDGVTAAIVPATPDRSLPNSVTYASAERLATSLTGLGAAYESAGVGAWTVWAPDFEREATAALEGAGHVLDGAPGAMVLELEGFRSPDLNGLDYDAECDMATLGRLNDAAYGLEGSSRLAPSFTRRPDGLEARYVGTTDGQLRIVALWESKEHADTFFAETLPSVLAKALGPEPAGSGVSEMVGIEVARSYVRQPVG